MIRVCTDLLAVKAEKLYDLSHTIEPTERGCWQEAEKSDWTTKNGAKPREVLKKCCLFISLFVGLLHKLKKK